MTHQIIVIGNLGRAPEMSYTPTGKAVTKFSVCENRQYTNAAGETVKLSTWFNVSAWGKNAENCSKYLVKGQNVTVFGILTADPVTGGPRIWEGKDGEKRASYEVSAEKVVFGGKPNGNHAAPEEEGAPVAEAPVEEAVDF